MKTSRLWPIVSGVIGFIVAVWGALAFHGTFTTSVPELDEPPIYRALHPPYNFRVLGSVIIAALMVVVGTYFFVTGVLTKKKWLGEKELNSLIG